MSKILPLSILKFANFQFAKNKNLPVVSSQICPFQLTKIILQMAQVHWRGFWSVQGHHHALHCPRGRSNILNFKRDDEFWGIYDLYRCMYLLFSWLGKEFGSLTSQSKLRIERGISWRQIGCRVTLTWLVGLILVGQIWIIWDPSLPASLIWTMKPSPIELW
jgi:hypothetical protein